jgi:hypothetical protein
MSRPSKSVSFEVLKSSEFLNAILGYIKESGFWKKICMDPGSLVWEQLCRKI